MKAAGNSPDSGRIENRESKFENGKALFLDRDGTLIVDRDYLADPAGVELIPGVPAALQRARELGYRLFLFTNQSGIGRGYHTIDDTRRCNDRMEDLIGLGRPLFDEICIAPEAPDQPSQYRKPSPRFIAEMIEKFDLDRTHSWMVGDRESDLLAGSKAGIKPVAVCTGKHDRDTWRTRLPEGVPLFHDLAEFVASLT